MQILSIALTIAFAIIAIFHVFWVLGYKLDIHNMVPVVKDEPVFTPGPIGTVIAAIVLCGFVCVSLALSFSDGVPVSYLPILKVIGIAIGVILLIRAVGDFKYAGFSNESKEANFQNMTIGCTLHFV